MAQQLWGCMFHNKEKMVLFMIRSAILQLMQLEVVEWHEKHYFSLSTHTRGRVRGNSTLFPWFSIPMVLLLDWVKNSNMFWSTQSSAQRCWLIHLKLMDWNEKLIASSQGVCVVFSPSAFRRQLFSCELKLKSPNTIVMCECEWNKQKSRRIELIFLPPLKHEFASQKASSSQCGAFHIMSS